MKFADIKIGYKGEFTRNISEEDNKKFGDLVQDYNPVHFDEARMKKSIFKQRATNGFLTESTIGTTLVHMFTSQESVVIALKKEIKLLAPVFIGDTITATVVVKEKDGPRQRIVCDCSVRKKDGTEVVKAEFLIKILEI